MRKAVLSLVVLLVLAAVIAAGSYYAMRREFVAPGPATAALRVQVDSGASARAVLTRLGALGALRHPRLTELYLRLTGRQLRIKAGEYEIPRGASAADIVTLLAEGRVVLEQLTVVEGTTFTDLRHLLDGDPKVRHTLTGLSDAQLMSALGHPGEAPEGRFFPDTYRFAAGTPDVELLKVAYDRMQAILSEAWSQRLPDLPVHSPYEALILASIVEKETGQPTERARIAGVFTARLRKGMRLQSDPTVIYGLTEGEHALNRELTRADLERATPYNTYAIAGLPPGPIANPGRASLLAATHPADTDALYFVADGSGGHVFASTLEEHNRNVARWRRVQRERSGEASPSDRNTKDTKDTKGE